MIVARITGGLGNQMFQYAMGRATALRWGVPLALHSYARLRRAPDWPYRLDRLNTVASFPSTWWRWRARFWRRRRLRPLGRWLHRRAPGLGLNCVCERTLDLRYDPQIMDLARGDAYLMGYWQTEKYFQPVAEVIRQDLAFRDPPDEPNARLLARLRECEACAVHVRRGDYLTDPHARRRLGTLDAAYYAEAARRITQRVPNVEFFVFSDDPAWCREHLAFDRPATWVEHNAGRQDHEDLRLMTGCKHFIIANSTFSWWGAWLAAHPDKIVIAPQRWFSHPEVTAYDLICPTWTAI